MVMLGVVSGSLQVDSQPRSVGLVWGLAAAWRRSTFIIWTSWTLEVLCHDDSTIIIILFITVIIKNEISVLLCRHYNAAIWQTIVNNCYSDENALWEEYWGKTEEGELYFHQNLIDCSSSSAHAPPLQKFHQNPFTTFWDILHTDTQTATNT